MSDMSPLITELLDSGKYVNLAVTGNSMYPFLREHIDSVLLEKVPPRGLRIGDIVLARKPDGRYVLHRVMKQRGGTFYLLGDAQTMPEGPFDRERVMAVVKGVKRRERLIYTSSRSWRLLSTIWLIIYPARPYLICFRRFLSGIRGCQA